MIFPNKYIKRGKFKLHSGQDTDIFYDVNEAITDVDILTEIILKINPNYEYIDTIVGIATGGAIIASQFYPFAMIKDGELKGKVGKNYILIDDVVTTESSLREAIDLIGYMPKDIYVVIDRRDNKIIEVKSIYEI